MAQNHKPLNKKMLKAIEIMVHEPYRKKGEIAEELKVSRATISAWCKREDFQQALKEENQRCFKDMAARAIKKLEQLLDSKNEGISLAAAREVLNKAGYMEVQKVEQDIKNEIVVEITGD